MPFAQLRSVREVSSEDLIHSSHNLINQLPGRKWKTKGIGEKCAYVILELTKPEQIIGIDIGNEHSAFIEVLVGKAGCVKEDFKDILITSSFMTPIESKNSTTVNRVRCFNKEALVSEIAVDKWQQIKIVCTQPFNKHVQYGLSFIKLHVLEATTKERPKYFGPEKFTKRKIYCESNNSDEEFSKPNQLLGFSKFNLRENSPDSDSESTTALFTRWKNSRKINEDISKLNTAAAIREASKVNNLNSKKQFTSIISSSGNSSVIDQGKNGIIDDKKGNINNTRVQYLKKHINLDTEYLRVESENAKLQDNEKLKETFDADSSFPKKGEYQLQQYEQKINISPLIQLKPASTELQYRQFNQLLRGVVLVISGIQNPDRSNLRSKALALGAKYKADWDQDCTHLICAFKNTPKYNQVKGIGKIVSRRWIEECFALKKYLPWRRYAIDNMELLKHESDEEILDENLKMNLSNIGNQAEKSFQLSKNISETKDSTLCMYDLGDSGDDKTTNPKEIDFVHLDSGSDTDDEIHRATQRDVQLNYNSCTLYSSNLKNIFEVETDEEDFLKEKLDLNKKL